ncbi:unnamed protein product, partial [Ectocarpus sp. 6 AP-2014]
HILRILNTNIDGRRKVRETEGEGEGIKRHAQEGAPDIFFHLVCTSIPNTNDLSRSHNSTKYCCDDDDRLPPAGWCAVASWFLRPSPSPERKICIGASKFLGVVVTLHQKVACG